MLLKNRLFTPGPTPLLPAAQTAMAAFTAHHRTADFKALFTRVLADMKDFIGTSNDVLVLASSGTGVMEGSVSNLTSPGDKVLVLTAGKFGERWRDLTKAYGCKWTCSRSLTARRFRWMKSARGSLPMCARSTCRRTKAQPAPVMT